MTDGNRAQSELLGFLLVFVIVILTIVLVGATGYVGLDNAQDYQRSANAEQAFVVLADNVDDVVRRGAPGRETEIGLAEASLALDGTEEINVTVDGTPVTADGEAVETQPIVYDTGTGTAVVYSSGAVTRQDGEHSIMIRQPAFVLTEETVLLPVVVTETDGRAHVGGSADVLVETRSRDTTVAAVDDDVSRVNISVTSERVDSWYRYFDEETAADCGAAPGPDDETIACSIDDPDRVYVTIERVNVEFT